MNARCVARSAAYGAGCDERVTGTAPPGYECAMSRTAPPPPSTRRRLAGAVALASVAAVAVAATPAAGSSDDQVRLGAAPAKTRYRTQIVGGTPITTAQAPHQVYVEIDAIGGGAYACGGSIIDARHVLTAAHCTFDGQSNVPIDTPSSYTVVAGVADLENGPVPGETPQVRTASAVSRHPRYVSPGTSGTLEELADDAAVITLPSPLNLSTSRVRSAPMVAPGANPATGTPAFASGYGDQVQGGTPDGRLYGLDTALVDAVAPDNAGPLNALYVMAQSTIGSTCQGDSGGGLLAGGAIIGIVSSGAACGQNEVGNFTSVAAGEIQTYVRNVVDGTNTPIPLAPRGGEEVTLTAPQAPEVGDTITCAPGTWTNGPTYGYTFSDAANGAVLQAGTGATYVLQTGDVGRTVHCRATATTPGGVGQTPVTRATAAVRAKPIPPAATPPAATPPATTPPATTTPATPTPTPPKPTPARFSSTLVSGSSKVRQGSRVSLRITVRNTGDVAAKNVRVCARVSSSFSVVARGGAKMVGGRLCWTTAQLGGGTPTRRRAATSVTHRFSLRADRDARPGRRTAATISVTAPGVRSASSRRLVTIQRRPTAATPGGVTG